MGFRKGRQYATTWVERAKNIRYNWNGRVGKYSEFECYVEALKRDPEYAEAWVGLTTELGKIGSDDHPFIAALSKIDLFKKPLETDKELAEVEITGDRDAISLLTVIDFCADKVISLNPKSIDAWYAYAKAYENWTGGGTNARRLKCFSEITKLDPDNVKAWYYLGELFNTGFSYWDDALFEICKNIFDGAENNVSTQRECAIKCYDKVIALSQQNDREKTYLASSYFGKGGVIWNRCFGYYRKSPSEIKLAAEEVLKLYDKALEHNPKNADVWHEKGLVFEQQSEYANSLECFEKYKQLKPRDHKLENEFHLVCVSEKLNPMQTGKPQSFRVFENYFEKLFGAKLSSADKDERIAGRKISGSKKDREKLVKKLIENVIIQTFEGSWHDEGNTFHNEQTEHFDKIKSLVHELTLENYDHTIARDISNIDFENAIDANNCKAEHLETSDAIECYKKSLEIEDESEKNPVFFCRGEKCQERFKYKLVKESASKGKTCDVCGSDKVRRVGISDSYSAEAYSGMAFLHKKRTLWAQWRLKQSGLTAESENNKAMECIEHAIKIEEGSDDLQDDFEWPMHWKTKCDWLSDDEEIIKFLDEQLDGKYTKESHKDGYHTYTHDLLEKKISVLKKLGRDDECKKAEEMLKKSIDDFQAEQDAEES